MIRLSMIVIILCIMCSGCGVKDDPEYKSQVSDNKNIYKI